MNDMLIYTQSGSVWPVFVVDCDQKCFVAPINTLSRKCYGKVHLQTTSATEDAGGQQKHRK